VFDRILVPVDKSEITMKALEAALSLADRFGAEVHLLHILDQAASLEHGEADADLDAIEKETKRLIAAGLSRLRNDHSVAVEQVKGEVRAGPVVQVISEAATELMVDVIVMGTHGRHRVTDMFTGSTAEQVVAKTSASVLVVKPDGFPFLRE
jgi:nucleotide-binding universal stress UspA family protein